MPSLRKPIEILSIIWNHFEISFEDILGSLSLLRGYSWNLGMTFFWMIALRPESLQRIFFFLYNYSVSSRSNSIQNPPDRTSDLRSDPICNPTHPFDPNGSPLFINFFGVKIRGVNLSNFSKKKEYVNYNYVCNLFKINLRQTYFFFTILKIFNLLVTSN